MRPAARILKIQKSGRARPQFHVDVRHLRAVLRPRVVGLLRDDYYPKPS